MKALSFRLRTLLVLMTFGCVAIFADSTRSRADDVPSLTKENGPFMVLARVFRGVDAEKQAKALATELRQEHKLAAYLLRTNPNGVVRYEELAVLVGDAKTLNESETILEQVKAINPRCLADRPFVWQRGLATARRTTNPLRPKAELSKKR
jgi:hypothetical protein